MLNSVTKFSLWIFIFSISWSSALYRMSLLSLLICFTFYIVSDFFSRKNSISINNIWRLNVDVYWIWPLLLTFWVFISCTWSPADPDLYYFDTGRYLKLLMVPVLAILIKKIIDENVYQVIWPFSIGVVVLMTPTFIDYFEIFHILGLDNIDKGNASYSRDSTLGLNLVYWRNQIVHGFSVSLLFGIMMMTMPKHGKIKYLHIVIASLCVFDVFNLIVGKMALISMITSILLVILLSPINKENKFKILFLALLLIIIFFIFNDEGRQRLHILWLDTKGYFFSNNNLTSIGTRWHYWHQSIEIFIENPLFGAGSGSFRHSLIATNDSHLGYSHYHTHNEYLTQLSQFGVIGFILFMGNFILMIMAIKSHPDSKFRKIIWLVVVIFLLNSFSDSSLHNEWEGWTLVIFFALAIANKLRFR